MSLSSILAEAKRHALAYDEEERRKREKESRADEELASLYKDYLREQIKATRDRTTGDTRYADEIARKKSELYDILVKEAKEKLYDPEGYARRMAQLEPDKWEKVKVAEAAPALPEKERENLLAAIRQGEIPATAETLTKLYGAPEKYEYKYKPPITDYEKTPEGFKQKLETEIKKAEILAGAKGNVAEMLKAQSEAGRSYIETQYAVVDKDNKKRLPPYALEVWMKYDPLITGKPLTREDLQFIDKEVKEHRAIEKFMSEYEKRVKPGDRDEDFIAGLLERNPDAMAKMKEMIKQWKEEDEERKGIKGQSLQPGGKYFPRLGVY